MLGAADDLFGGALLDDFAHVEDVKAVRDLADDGEVVGDEK